MLHINLVVVTEIKTLFSFVFYISVIIQSLWISFKWHSLPVIPKQTFFLVEQKLWMYEHPGCLALEVHYLKKWYFSQLWRLIRGKFDKKKHQTLTFLKYKVWYRYEAMNSINSIDKFNLIKLIKFEKSGVSACKKLYWVVCTLMMCRCRCAGVPCHLLHLLQLCRPIEAELWVRSRRCCRLSRGVSAGWPSTLFCRVCLVLQWLARVGNIGTLYWMQ